MGGSDREYAGNDEVRCAIDALSIKELVRLRRYAKFLLGGLGREACGADWKDLLQESIYRTLSGSRRWPRDIDFSWHIHETMRSILNSWGKRNNSNAAIESGILTSGQDSGIRGAPEFISSAPPLDQALSAREAVEQMRLQIQGDIEAIAVFNSWAIGMTGPEVQRALGFTAIQYRAITKRIYRHLKSTSSGTSGGPDE